MKPIASIGIDPGHGGEHRGTHISGGPDEADYVLALARRIEYEIHADELPVRTVLLRRYDQSMSLRERAELAKSNGCTLVLSQHVNAQVFTAAPQRVLRGLSCFYWPGNSQGLRVADAIIARRPHELAGNCKPVVATTEEEWKANARAVVGVYPCTCVLTEHGFARPDADAMLHLDIQRQLALAQVAGVREFLEAIHGR